MEMNDQKKSAELRLLVNKLVAALQEIENIEQRLESEHGVKIGLVSLSGRKRRAGDWSVHLSAGIDKTAASLGKVAEVKDRTIRPIKRKEFIHRKVSFAQSPKNNPTDIYE